MCFGLISIERDDDVVVVVVVKLWIVGTKPSSFENNNRQKVLVNGGKGDENETEGRGFESQCRQKDYSEDSVDDQLRCVSLAVH